MLALVACVALGYLLFLVWPYYANGLDRYPLEEVAGGAHDPRDLWPRNTSLGGAVGLGGLLTVLLGPFAAAAAAVWAGAQLMMRRRPDARGSATLALTLLLALATLTWALSPVGTALVSWWMD